MFKKVGVFLSSFALTYSIAFAVATIDPSRSVTTYADGDDLVQIEPAQNTAPTISLIVEQDLREAG